MAGGSAPSSIVVPTTDAPKGGVTKYTAPLAVLTTLFFMWGLITSLNDSLIPHFKAMFELNYVRAMLIQFAFFGAYGIVSIPAGLLVNRIGYKAGIMLGLGTAAFGCLLFYPAAEARSYEFFLGALFILASGITMLQVSANPFVAVLGRPETASARLSLSQAVNSLGHTLANTFGSIMILAPATLTAVQIAALKGADLDAYRASEAQAVQGPYLGLAAALLTLAVAIALFKLPRIAASASDRAAATGDTDRGSAWRYPHLVLGAVGIFIYVGAEVTIGSFIINYFKEADIANLPEAKGALYLSLYWGGAMIGRFVGSALLRMIRPGRALAGFAVAACSLVTISILTSGQAAMWSILAVGLFNSIMFPTIFALAIDGLGRHTGQASGILCTAIIGGAFLPLIQGYFADRIGIHLSFIVPALCYVYIAWYGLKGHSPARRTPVL